MDSEQISHALAKAKQLELAQARLRLALRCLSGAAEANVSLFETNEWHTALAAVAALLGQLKNQVSL